MRLERVVHTIEINHRANKPIYPITFETDNDNNTIIPSIVSTKVAEKPAILPIFKTIENRRSIFFLSLFARLLHVQRYIVPTVN